MTEAEHSMIMITVLKCEHDNSVKYTQEYNIDNNIRNW